MSREHGREAGTVKDLIGRILERLDRVVRRADGWSARCPAHEDHEPSLSISEAEDGSVITHCFAGCSREEIVAALKMTERDLHPAREPSSARRPAAARTPPKNKANHGLSRVGDPGTDGLSLETLATAKKIPVGFLNELGCTNAPGPSVRIPYYNESRTETSVRYRMSLKGARFKWRTGDHVLPYGLERLADARTVGWLLLVEGESDCWTAWHLGLPALGIPGKATWQPEWAQYVAGLQVYLWQEPDAGDIVDRVAKDVVDVRVIVAPDGTQDISDAHVRGDDVVALIERLKLEAKPARKLLGERAEERLLDAYRQAAPILAHPDPLILVEAEIRAQGYGGDLRPPLHGYLAATSRVLAPRRGSMAAHTLFKAASSGGKNAAMSAGLRLLPDESVHVIDAGSARVLIYDDAPLEHRVVVFAEADSLPTGEDNPAASAIRNLLQDGHLHYDVVERDATTGSFGVRHVRRPGPTVLLTTSTRSLGPQIMTRLFSVEVPDEPAQLRAALAAQAAMELDEPPPPNEALIAFQRYLQAKAPIDVLIPFAARLATYLGRQPTGPRVLRDFPRLMALIKATAVVRIAHRECDHRGRLVATIDDYAAVYCLVVDTYQASAGASARVRDAISAVARLAAEKAPGSTVSISEVANSIAVPIPSAWRRVRDAIVGGWLVNDETRKSQTAKLRIGEALPSSSTLPSPEELAALDPAGSSENVKTTAAEVPRTTDSPATGPVDEHGGPHAGLIGASVFTFSPVTGGSPVKHRPRDDGNDLQLPTIPDAARTSGSQKTYHLQTGLAPSADRSGSPQFRPVEQAGGGLDLPLNAENVKTPTDAVSQDDWIDVKSPAGGSGRETPTLWDLP